MKLLQLPMKDYEKKQLEEKIAELRTNERWKERSMKTICLMAIELGMEELLRNPEIPFGMHQHDRPTTRKVTDPVPGGDA